MDCIDNKNISLCVIFFSVCMTSFSEMFHVSSDTFESTKNGMQFSGLLGIKMIIGTPTNRQLGWGKNLTILFLMYRPGRAWLSVYNLLSSFCSNSKEIVKYRLWNWQKCIWALALTLNEVCVFGQVTNIFRSQCYSPLK